MPPQKTLYEAGTDLRKAAKAFVKETRFDIFIIWLLDKTILFLERINKWRTK